jgi:hypothetical protein
MPARAEDRLPDVLADLVDVLTEHPDDPVRQSVALDERIADHVAPYYGDQAKVDSARLAMMRHSVFDSPLPFPSAQDTELTFPALRAAAMVNQTAFRAFWALMGMLRRPDDVYSDPVLAAAVDQSRELEHSVTPLSPIWKACSPP